MRCVYWRIASQLLDLKPLKQKQRGSHEDAGSLRFSTLAGFRETSPRAPRSANALGHPNGRVRGGDVEAVQHLPRDFLCGSLVME